MIKYWRMYVAIWIAVIVTVPLMTVGFAIYEDEMLFLGLLGSIITVLLALVNAKDK